MTGTGERRFAAVLTACFAIAASAVALFHEPWRDERGPWGVALASGSLGEFLSFQRYSGHGRSWHLCVLAIERTIGDFRAVQALSVAFATAAAFLFARFAPFSRLQRALLVFGYFPFFEYGVIARPYGLGLLAAAAACATFRLGNPVPLAVALFFLAQTTVFGVIVAAGIAAARLAEELRSRGRAPPAARTAAAATLLAGFALAVAQLVPPADSGFAPEWRTGLQIFPAAKTVAAATAGLLPIPELRPGFWGTNLLDGMTKTRAVVGAALLVACALVLARSRAALVLFAVATVGLLAFGYSKYLGELRHHGHFFVAFVAACWIAGSALDRRRSACLSALLAVHAAVGAFAGVMDVVHPFSASGATADFLRARGLDRLPIAGDHDSQAAGVAAALGRPIFFPGSGRTSTFVRWDDRRRRSMSDGEVIDAAEELAVREEGEVVLVMNRVLADRPADVELLAGFEGTLAADEVFYVYRVRAP